MQPATHPPPQVTVLMCEIDHCANEAHEQEFIQRFAFMHEILKGIFSLSCIELVAAGVRWHDRDRGGNAMGGGAMGCEGWC